MTQKLVDDLTGLTAVVKYTPYDAMSEREECWVEIFHKTDADCIQHARLLLDKEQIETILAVMNNVRKTERLKP